MAEIRPSRARARLRTALIIAPFLASGVAFAASAGAQELPGGVATNLFEQALKEQITPPSVDAWVQDSIPTILAWIVGLVTAALVMRRLRGELGRFAGQESSETTHSDPETAPSVVPDVQEASVVASRLRKPSKPPEVLKLPPHVLAILERSAAARAAGRAALRPESPGDSQYRRRLDVTVPRYDPSRSED